jgi:hypothetical protein
MFSFVIKTAHIVFLTNDFLQDGKIIFLLWVVRNEIGILIKTKMIENKTHQNQIGESKFFEFPSNVICNFLVFDDGRYLGQFDF